MDDQRIPPSNPGSITAVDLVHLRRCVELAQEAVEVGDEPFGSVLVDAAGNVLFEDRNRVAATGDQTQHPEFAIARWAAQNLEPEQRKAAVVYTSGEHCAMCSAAHAWVGLGRIVYASSTDQLVSWFGQWGIPFGPVAPHSISEIAPGVSVAGPVEELAAEIKQLHKRCHRLGRDQ